MYKFKKAFNCISAFVFITTLIFSISFITKRINEFKEKRAAVKTNITYIQPENEQPEYYEEYIENKPKEVFLPEDDNINKSASETEKNENKTDYSIFTKNIVKKFSENKLVYNAETMDYRTHNGIDIKITGEIPVFINSKVDCVEETGNGHGNIILSAEDDMLIEFRGIIINSDVKQGSELEEGEIIGVTSESNDNIFFLGIKKEGIYINPTEFFKQI